MIRALCMALALASVAVAAPAAAADADAPAPSPPRILVLLRQVPAHYRAGAAYGGSYGDATTRAVRERLGRRIARENGLAFLGNWPMPVVGLDCFILAVPAGETPEAAAARVARHAAVEWAEPVHSYRTFATPAYNDPLFPVAPVTRQWRLAELHGLATGRGVSVAVIDTRVEAGHPDLAGQVYIEEDFVAGRRGGAERHGTGVAGIIAAKADNGVGMVGVAPRARLMALRACWQLPGDGGSACDSLSLAKALHFAIERRAQVINLSLSGPPDRLLGTLIDAGLRRGAVVVAAADADAPGGGFPASQAGVVAVSDVPFAAAPRGVVSAPGDGVPTTQPGGRWYVVGGSSYAAAHVSGLFALMREGRPGARGRSHALVPVSGAGGAIDAPRSLRQAVAPCDQRCAREPVVQSD